MHFPIPSFRLTQCSFGPRVFTPNRTSIRSAVFAYQSRVKPRDRHTDKQGDRQSDKNIGSNSLFLMHSMQPKTYPYVTNTVSHAFYFVTRWRHTLNNKLLVTKAQSRLLYGIIKVYLPTLQAADCRVQTDWCKCTEKCFSAQRRWR